HLLVHAVHGLRIARLSDTGNSPVLDPDVALDDSQHRVDHENVRDDKVQSAIRRRDGAMYTETVPEGLAAAEHALVSRHQQVSLHLGPQFGIPQPDAIAR